MAPSGDGGFQGINPSMLAQLIKALGSGVTGAQPVASSYVAHFNRLGLDTGAVQRLLADYAWASGQQPMLNRRYSLASHQPPADFSDGWTAEGSGALAYTSTGAARQAGTTDAKRMQAYLDDHDWTGIQKELDALSQNQGDADYMAAFFKELGPSGLYALSLLALPGGNKSEEQEVQDVVGNGLATASYEMPLTMEFLQGIEPSDPPVGYSTEEMPGGWDTAALAPFLTQGKFSSQWLNVIAPAVLYQKGAVETAGLLPGGYDAIFQAIANNPGFAAQFYQQNSGQLNDYMTDPLLYHQLASDPGFGKFLEAATIPPPGTTNSKPFTDNAAAFIKLFGDSGADTSSTVRQVMAAVTVNYFGDLVGTVTAAAPGAGSAMGLTASEWGMFVQDAMKDKTSAAYLLTAYANWRGQQPLDSVSKHGAGDGPDTPLHAGYWHDASYGMLNYFFASNYQAAGATAGDSTNSIEETVLSALSAGGATLLTSVLFGPEAAVPELLADAGKDAFSNATEGTLDKLTAQLADGGSGSSGGSQAGDLASSLSNYQQQWADLTESTWQQSGSTPGNPKIQKVHYNGLPYNGDPLPYEEQYGKAGYFMNSDGSLMYNTTQQWAAHPQALAAYNAWLQDPAISNAVGSQFSVQEGGALADLYAHEFGGS